MSESAKSLEINERDGERFESVVALRFITPDGTTTSQPRLQQAWQRLRDGRIEWRDVPTVVVSYTEFRSLSPTKD